MEKVEEEIRWVSLEKDAQNPGQGSEMLRVVAVALRYIEPLG